MKLNLKIKGKPYKSEKITKAAELVSLALGSEEFKAFIKNFSYMSTTCSGALWWRRCNTVKRTRFHYTDMSNEEVLAKILSGAESLNKNADGEIDIEVEVDHRYRRGVIGYTYPAIPTQYIYKWVS